MFAILQCFASSSEHCRYSPRYSWMYTIDSREHAMEEKRARGFDVREEGNVTMDGENNKAYFYRADMCRLAWYRTLYQYHLTRWNKWATSEPKVSLGKFAERTFGWRDRRKREAYQSACHEILIILVRGSIRLSQASRSLRNLMRDDNNAPHYFHVATYNLQQRRRSRKARDDPDRMATLWRNPSFYAYVSRRSDLPRNPLREIGATA